MVTDGIKRPCVGTSYGCEIFIDLNEEHPELGFSYGEAEDRFRRCPQREEYEPCVRPVACLPVRLSRSR